MTGIPQSTATIIAGMCDRSQNHFAICVQNDAYPASLELRKIYRVLPDEHAAAHRQLRVIDESGEDYLFPAELFVPISLPRAAESAFAMSG